MGPYCEVLLSFDLCLIIAFNHCINMSSQSVKGVHSVVPLFETIFVGGTKIDKVTGNTVSKISHLNLNVSSQILATANIL